MSKINVLDSSVFNRIAAGEVVDKPASVVKELVENAVDSGATAISVSVRKGGKFICVTDNGSGIAEDDVRTAFLPHATSKIRSLDDLDAITTLGFRGEALPSIASVAKVTVLTRTAEADFGVEYAIENGRELSFLKKGAPFGTTVTVEDLFSNVPARLKFMRSDRSEEGEISALMQRIIIANFNIAISFTVNDKEVYRSSGKGLKEAVYATYGMNFLKETDYIQSTMSDMELYGYINKPAFSKHNRSYQTLIVNGRYVVNQDVSFWIYNCFSGFLMKRQYPAYVLFLNLPGDMVDINVHPSKMEVKFVHFDSIRRLLSAAISQSLQATTHEPKVIELNREDRPENPDKPAYPTETTGALERPSVSSPETGFSDDTPYPDVRITGKFMLNDSYSPSEAQPVQFHIDRPKARQYELFHDIIATEKTENPRSTDLSDYAYTGKLFNTYLLLEKDAEVIMIDQHAAHEKILYERLVKAVDSGQNSVQDLLVPYIFEVDAQEAALIDENMPLISELGFILGRLSGNSYSLSAVPMILNGMGMKDFVAILIDSLRRCRLSKKSFLKEDMMQSACKAAVKGEMDLSESEIEQLLREIAETGIELFCPHGRPIAIKIKRTEIEKWFKRIV